MSLVLWSNCCPVRGQCVKSQNVSRLAWIVSCGGEEVGAIVWRDGVDEIISGRPQSLEVRSTAFRSSALSLAKASSIDDVEGSCSQRFAGA